MEEVPLDTEKPQRELSWWPSGSDSMLPMQRAWVSSLVRELRSQMPHGVTKKEKKNVDAPEGSYRIMRLPVSSVPQIRLHGNR